MLLCILDEESLICLLPPPPHPTLPSPHDPTAYNLENTACCFCIPAMAAFITSSLCNMPCLPPPPPSDITAYNLENTACCFCIPAMAAFITSSLCNMPCLPPPPPPPAISLPITWRIQPVVFAYQPWLPSSHLHSVTCPACPPPPPPQRYHCL